LVFCGMDRKKRFRITWAIWGTQEKGEHDMERGLRERTRRTTTETKNLKVQGFPESRGGGRKIGRNKPDKREEYNPSERKREVVGNDEPCYRGTQDERKGRTGMLERQTKGQKEPETDRAAISSKLGWGKTKSRKK